MEKMEDDPWAALRDASRSPDAGRFAYNDAPPERARVSAWEWIKFFAREGVRGWLRKQLPPANRTLDSSYYLGINRHKKVARNAVKKALGKEPEKSVVRTPVVIAGRRIGIPGLVLSSFAAVVLLSVVRSILNF